MTVWGRLPLTRHVRFTRQAWYFDPIYLSDPETGEHYLFVHQFVEYVTSRGQTRRRKACDVWEFPNEEAMMERIEEWNMLEAPKEAANNWVPDEYAGAW